MRERSHTQSITYYNNISIRIRAQMYEYARDSFRCKVRNIICESGTIYICALDVDKKTICRYSFIRKFGFFLDSVIGNYSLRNIIIIVIDVFDFCSSMIHSETVGLKNNNVEFHISDDTKM